MIRKASIDTEEFWLEICRQKNYRDAEKLVRYTPKGAIPGDLPDEDEKEAAITDLRLRLGVTGKTVVERGLQVYSLEQGRPVPLAEAVEMLFARLLEKDGTSSADLDALAQGQREARKDLLAQQQRRQPLVQEARALAQSMGLADASGECQELAGIRDFEGPVEHLAAEFLATMEMTDIAPAEFPARGTLNNGEDTDAQHRRGPTEAEFPARETQEYGSNVEPSRPRAAALKISRAEFPAREIPYDDNSARAEMWEQVLAAHQVACPDNENVVLLANDWRNRRLRFNQEARLPTPAQRREMIRRDGYCCSTPGCSNHLWLEVHHVVLYSRKGKTIGSNLVTLCSRCHKNVHRGHLRISGQAPDKLVFRDREGRDLYRTHALGVAGWLDFWCGWSGGRENSHQHRWAQEVEGAGSSSGNAVSRAG